MDTVPHAPTKLWRSTKSLSIELDRGHMVALAALSIVVSAGFLFSMLVATGGHVVSSLDDAYIHQQYAREIATGHPARYNPEDPPTSGFSSLTYPLVLAAGYLLGFQGDNLSIFAFLFGAAMLLVSSLLVYRIVTTLTERARPDPIVPPATAGVVAAVLFLLSGGLPWGFLSGMESGLFVTLVLLTIDSLVCERRVWTAMLLIATALTRSEGSVLVAVFVGVVTLQWLLNRSARTSVPMRWLPLLLVAVAAQPLVYLLLTGSPTAAGMVSKSWLYSVPFVPGEVLGQIASTYDHAWVALAGGVSVEEIRSSATGRPGFPLYGWGYLPPGLAVAGFLYLLRQVWGEAKRRRPGPATIVVLWLAIGMLAVSTLYTAFWHHSRYFLAFYAVAMLVGSVGLADLLGMIGTRFRHLACRLWYVLTIVFVVLSLPSILVFGWSFAKAAEATRGQQIAMADWVAKNLPPDARVGVHDAGAVRYVGNRYTYDLVGLTTRDASAAWRSGPGSVYEMMAKAPNRPDYFAIYNDVLFLPYFLDTGIFGKELFRTQVTDMSGVSTASATQYVYQADWHLAGSGDRLYQPDILQRLHGLTPVDSLNVADLQDEARHDYQWHHVESRSGYPTEVRRQGYVYPEKAEVLDGGRLLTGGESFQIATRPGQDLQIVGRFHAVNDVTLRVSVDGAYAGTWRYASLPGKWQESIFTVPGRLISRTTTTIDLEADTTLPGFRFHNPYYYWFYQGSVPEINATHLQRASFGPEIDLLGYDADSSQLKPGGTFVLTLYWSAKTDESRNYKVFVHLADAADRVVAQHDGEPGYGQHPTRLWVAGETIADQHVIPVPPDLPSSAYTVWIGLYSPANGQRVAPDGGDPDGRLRLTTVSIRP